MRKVSTSEIIELTSLLQMESSNLANAKAAKELAKDSEFKNHLNSLVQTGESRIKGLQQIIQEQDIPIMEVH